MLSYYQRNRIRITAKRQVQLETCECGKTYQRKSSKQHKLSLSHRVFMEQKAIVI